MCASRITQQDVESRILSVEGRAGRPGVSFTFVGSPGIDGFRVGYPNQGAGGLRIRTQVLRPAKLREFGGPARLGSRRVAHLVIGDLRRVQACSHLIDRPKSYSWRGGACSRSRKRSTGSLSVTCGSSQVPATVNRQPCRLFQPGAVACRRTRKTFNPKVAGSIPARPMLRLSLGPAARLCAPPYPPRAWPPRPQRRSGESDAHRTRWRRPRTRPSRGRAPRRYP